MHTEMLRALRAPYSLHRDDCIEVKNAFSPFPSRRTSELGQCYP